MFVHDDVSMKLIDEKDLRFLLDIRNDSWKTLGTIDMINSTKQKDWYNNILSDPTKNYYIVYNAIGIKVGVIRMDEIDYINRSARVGCDIHNQFQKAGNAQKAMKMIIYYSFNYLNMNRLWLMVMESNKKAYHIYQKVGFIEEGRQRQGIYRNGFYEDYILMGLLREEKE
jgi:RimJ/RimL family protein N-acetyltransferase